MPPNNFASEDSRVERTPMKGFVWFVGAGPGDPDLMTLRGWRAVQEADVVLYDSLVDPRLIDGLQAECIYVGKRCGRHSMSQQEITRLLVRLARAGRRVVRLKGGDPAVLGRLGEEALCLAESDIPFEVVPGVTSATAVPELAGIPVTHRGLADSFVVASAHGCMDSPGLSIPPYQPRTTLVLMMARATADAWQRQLVERGYPLDLPAALISRGASAAQRVLVSSVGCAVEDLRSCDLETPVLAVIGRVVTLHAQLAPRRNGEATKEFYPERGETMLTRSTPTEGICKAARALALTIGLLFWLGVPSAPAVAAEAGSDAAPAGWEQWLDNEFYKVHLDVRLRFEAANFEGLDASQASTIRTRFGIGTKPLYGFSLYAEGENILAFDTGEYFDVVEAPTGQTGIADPEDTELNQAWVRYENPDLLGLKVTAGRQRIKLDDDRFIGNVGWRQNEQTYDSAYVSISPGIEHLRVEYGYIWYVKRIFGDDGPAIRKDFDSNSHLIRVAYDRWKAAKIVGFAYLLDFQGDSPGNSSNSYGLRVSGNRAISGPWGLGYAASFAYQMDADDNPVNYNARYVAAETSLTHTDAGALTLGYEMLGSDSGKARFVTPLATGHKFNGWADVFLNNGGNNGLQDLYLTLAPKLPWKLKGKIVYHHFWSDEGSESLANELDAVLSRPITKHFSVLTKAAWFEGTDRGAADGYRWWMQLTFKY
ncbi:MAG: uroporphyrinogen-III C-methyltransferase [Deltaproteobacteria bacterium]|nr:uroporphyrinogen-III C-methyltransferase [Deltaproteobacteria bacterium]